MHLQLCVHGLLQQVWDLLLLERSLFQDDYSICALSREASPLEYEWIKSSANTDPALGGQSEVRDHSRHLTALTVLMPKPPCRPHTHPKINSIFAWKHSKLSTPPGNTSGFLEEQGMWAMTQPICTSPDAPRFPADPQHQFHL